MGRQAREAPQRVTPRLGLLLIARPFVAPRFQQAFGFDGRELPAGALTLLAHDAQPGEACWARADPVHLRLMRDRLVLVGGGPRFSAEQAAELGYDRIFGRGTKPSEVASYLAHRLVMRAGA